MPPRSPLLVGVHTVSLSLLTHPLPARVRPQQVYRAIEKAPYHVLAVDDQKFHDVLVEPGKKRDFPVVALFTAAAPKYGCTPCQ